MTSMTTRCLTLAAMLLVLAACAANANAAGHRRQALVLLDRTASDAHASADAVITRNSLRRVRADVAQVGLVTVSVPRGVSFATFARKLRRDADVKSVERQRTRSTRYAPNDPAFSKADPFSN